jgi:hypothetical protein
MTHIIAVSSALSIPAMNQRSPFFPDKMLETGEEKKNKGNGDVLTHIGWKSNLC